MTRRILRRAAWITAAPALVCSALLAWNLAEPFWISRGSMSAGVTGGQVEIARGSGKMVRQPSAWATQDPVRGNMLIVLGPHSAWRPSISGASLGTSSSAGAWARFRLTALYIPLWPWTLSFGGGAALLWWRSRRIVIPGHCEKCGYNLEGLAAERCPECGAPLAGLAKRVVRLFGPVRTTRGHRRLPLGIAR